MPRCLYAHSAFREACARGFVWTVRTRSCGGPTATGRGVVVVGRAAAQRAAGLLGGSRGCKYTCHGREGEQVVLVAAACCSKPCACCPSSMHETWELVTGSGLGVQFWADGALAT